MKIEKVTRYVVYGKDFPDLAKAKDYVDGKTADAMQRYMLNKGFTASEAFKVAQILIDHKAEFVELLSCKFEDESSEDVYGFHSEDT